MRHARDWLHLLIFVNCRGQTPPFDDEHDQASWHYHHRARVSKRSHYSPPCCGCELKGSRYMYWIYVTTVRCWPVKLTPHQSWDYYAQIRSKFAALQLVSYTELLVQVVEEGLRMLTFDLAGERRPGEKRGSVSERWSWISPSLVAIPGLASSLCKMQIKCQV
ncbi:hypothetical protein JB92DRAFT_2903688 [Gautieria morchelliformis]|nr:hypothetical protein JB92DRAFT_2903688 [Gautieria morchelliformis]